jgi:hypothetical protein
MFGAFYATGCLRESPAFGKPFKPLTIMNKPAKLLLLIATALLAPVLCWANIVFELGNNPQPNEENVLLNNGTTGNLVTGTTNQSGATVNFTSTQTLTEPSSGQARIEATNGSGQVGLTNVSFSLASGSFEDTIFNPSIVDTVGIPGGAATVTVVANDGTFTFTYTLGNGNNFLTVFATGGELIESVSLSYSLLAGFTDLRQVRISGVTAPTVPDSGATLSLLGASLIGLAFLRRKLAGLKGK